MQTQTRRTQICLAFDAETNPSYYRARHYDPAAERFLSTHRIRFVASVNFYRDAAEWVTRCA
jgi:RHS repeat-associated protein